MKKEAVVPFLLALALTGCAGGSSNSSNTNTAAGAAVQSGARIESTAPATLIQCDLVAEGSAHGLHVSWDILDANVLQASLTSPSDSDSPVADLGSNPSDPMFFCTTTRLEQAGDHIQVEVTIKRVAQATAVPCSSLSSGQTLSTQTQSFGLGNSAVIHFRHAKPNGGTESRLRILYFSRPGELPGATPEEAREKCEDIVHERQNAPHRLDR